jgi:hypothetical protein
VSGPQGCRYEHFILDFYQVFLSFFTSSISWVLSQNYRRTKMKKMIFSAIVVTGMLLAGTSEAVQTKLIIRAQSKDAKFIGTSMGGAAVVLKDSETGTVLAQGLTAGSTGDTKKIMIEPLHRGSRLTDDSTAFFEAALDIEEPKLVTIEVEAPLARKPNMIKSSTQVWVIPGKDILGDGIIVEVPGFAVDVIMPESDSEITLKNGVAEIPIHAKIVMI